jgi:hypothetical protein
MAGNEANPASSFVVDTPTEKSELQIACIDNCANGLPPWNRTVKTTVSETQDGEKEKLAEKHLNENWLTSAPRSCALNS